MCILCKWFYDGDDDVWLCEPHALTWYIWTFSRLWQHQLRDLMYEVCFIHSLPPLSLWIIFVVKILYLIWIEFQGQNLISYQQIHYIYAVYHSSLFSCWYCSFVFQQSRIEILFYSLFCIHIVDIEWSAQLVIVAQYILDFQRNSLYTFIQSNTWIDSTARYSYALE